MSRTPSAAHVAVATLNQTVGDWEGNRRRVSRALTLAREAGARLVVLPEMCLSGYSLCDRLLMRGTLERSEASLRALLPETQGIVALVGLPVRHRDVLYNAVAVVADGRLVGLVPKENLATGDVQYENRYFSGWPRGRVESWSGSDGVELPFGSLLFEAAGLGRFAVEVCEDGWKGIRPGSVAALAGAQIVCNPSASWFTLGKHRIRRQMVEQISREDKVVYLYTSLHGCDATRLVFDGSAFIAQDGRTLAEGRRFVFDEEVVLTHRRVDLASQQRARTEEGSWRQQVESLQRGDLGQLPPVVRVPGDYATSIAPPPPPPYWQAGTLQAVPVRPSPDPSLDHLVQRGLLPPFQPTDLPHVELELALCLGLREYQVKCGIPGFTIALSGGRDSGMCAFLVARMLRYHHPDLTPEALAAVVQRRLTTAYLATDHSGSTTRLAARALAESLGATHHEGFIQDAVDTHVRLVAEMTKRPIAWEDPSCDIPLQNVQARLRGSLIWMIANLSGHLLLVTSNKSEAAVGYTTMDGDTSGGFAPLADIPKSLISTWLEWAAAFHDQPAVRQVCGAPATAELRPPEQHQTDEDDLMPFAVLDRLMYHFVQLGQDPLDLFESLWPEFAPRYGHRPQAFAAHIRKFVRMFCQAQWKRERFAISLRVMEFDLDPKTGFRFPPVQEPFSAELAELEARIARGDL